MGQIARYKSEIMLHYRLVLTFFDQNLLNLHKYLWTNFRLEQCKFHIDLIPVAG